MDIVSENFKADRFPVFARLRSEEPIHRTILPDKNKTPARLVTRCLDGLDDKVETYSARRLSGGTLTNEPVRTSKAADQLAERRPAIGASRETKHIRTGEAVIC